MRSIRVRAASAVPVFLGTMLAVIAVTGVEAQAPAEVAEPMGWSFTLVGEGGLIYSTRDLGKGQITQPNGHLAQMRSQTRTSPTAAAGVEIQSPVEELRMRLMARTTLDGGARGQLGGCRVVTPDEAGDACVEVDTEGSIRTVTGGLVFIRPRRESGILRLYLTLDGGLRFYSYDHDTCGQDSVGNPEWIAAICSGQENIAQDQTRVVLEVGVGVRTDLGPASGYLHVLDAFGRYESAGQAEGETQNALIFSAGVAWPLGG